MFRYYEFFAGGGMASAGLGPLWSCLFANDFDAMKAKAYRANWPGHPLHEGDVAEIVPADLPGYADLCWASTPCQDLSLAGDAAGLGRADDPAQTRSGAFWPWWRLVRSLGQEGRLPRICVLENVVGALASNGGKDFAELIGAFVACGYRVGAVVIDARHFLPQSRPRLFVIGVAPGETIPNEIAGAGPMAPWHPDTLTRAYSSLPPTLQHAWLWWHLPIPSAPVASLASLVEQQPTGVEWHSEAETQHVIGLMSPENRRKLAAAMDRSRHQGRIEIGTLYRRSRPDGTGKRQQRAEVRFDGVAGCLRTASGGSSRQTIVVVDGSTIRTRLLSSRETARLMGLPDQYRLPERYNDAYHLAGDGVAVPVVRFLTVHLFQPVLTSRELAIAAE